jgi:5-hydroxyisourate hydrolase
MSRISSHVLDTAIGRPARSLGVRLDRLEEGGGWTPLGRAVTGDDGRVADVLPGTDLPVGTYRLTFETASYLEAAGRPVFFPQVDVVFRVGDAGEHFHIPLLLSPFGYSTYRGG